MACQCLRSVAQGQQAVLENKVGRSILTRYLLFTPVSALDAIPQWVEDRLRMRLPAYARVVRTGRTTSPAQVKAGPRALSSLGNENLSVLPRSDQE